MVSGQGKSWVLLALSQDLQATSLKKWESQKMGFFSTLVLTPKNQPHRTTSKNDTIRCPQPWWIFAHYLAKNHAIKNPIKPKYAPGPRAQYGQAPLLSAKGRILEGVHFTQWIEDEAFLGGEGSNNHPFELQAIKILSNWNMCQDPVHNMVECSCSVLRVERWMGSLLDNKSKLGHFLWGEPTIIHLNFHVPL